MKKVVNLFISAASFVYLVDGIVDRLMVTLFTIGPRPEIPTKSLYCSGFVTEYYPQPDRHCEHQ